MNPIVPELFYNRLFIEGHNGQKIIVADYSGLKPPEMMELHKMHVDLLAKTGLSFIADFHSTYATPSLMNLARSLVPAYQHLVFKGAFLGVDKIKSAILKGFTMAYNLDFRAFDTKEDALGFVTKRHRG
jgi:hypothetical protein